MQCDKCNSDNTQRLEVVFEGGTSIINTRSHSAGVGIGGDFGVGGITTRTSGTSQTVTGGKAAPPAKKTYAWAIINIFLAWFFYGFGVPGLIIGVLLFVLAIYLYRTAANYNKNIWPPLYKYWQECWLCHKCGNIYHHE